MTPFRPAYLALLATGELEGRVAEAWRHLESFDLCARYCRVNRHSGLQGVVCHTGERAVVHGYCPHHGEEDPLRGSRGSGTVFFTWCNLRCEFCQNWEISQAITRPISAGFLIAAIILLGIVLAPANPQKARGGLRGGLAGWTASAKNGIMDNGLLEGQFPYPPFHSFIIPILQYSITPYP